jgi:hypothetical protein
MENLVYYEQLRSVPEEAQREIKGGRLSGMTDINPMWRIKALTEAFGPYGVGWYFDIIDKRLVDGTDGAIACFVDITLYYMDRGEWSKGAPGTGGSMFVSKEKAGMYVSDECFKMALTDAISVAAKLLGVGADVYWRADATKYGKREELDNENEKEQKKRDAAWKAAEKALSDKANECGVPYTDLPVYFFKRYGVTISAATTEQLKSACSDFDSDDAPEFIKILELEKKARSLWEEKGFKRNQFAPSFVKRFGHSVEEATVEELETVIDGIANR